ncbi:hypothetical protein SNE40_021438 [Patella caerulea]|uniref:Uncharacterized protein n=1 Tax=Patella caerulea TaxID=87958 RepID=A0AAN8IXI9_PATCE
MDMGVMHGSCMFGRKASGGGGFMIEGGFRKDKRNANLGYWNKGHHECLEDRVVVVVRYVLEGIREIRIMDMGVKVVMNVKR